MSDDDLILCDCGDRCAHAELATLRAELERKEEALRKLVYADAAGTICRNCGLAVVECIRYPGGCRDVIEGRRALEQDPAPKEKHHG